ncbi:AAA family ATPase [Zunongwangia endophytica]|uniref:ATP/GTP-binding protein n=1 Tax=Zunongwangia endophytica TaxID=1808945 RepID=A0ABV8HE01_9FLAO|nr:ATP-binding protein [Zunongwangia endophytica]MDN3594168.1 ATP-binding protein [Zunongwangia endophytica]
MIIEFSVENFLSFKDLTTLSMVKAKSFKEHNETHTFQIDPKLSLLKSAIIYGNNASGKSNLLEAMGFMKGTVINSFRDALMDNNERKFPLEKFILSSKSENESSYFEIVFINNNVKYRYGFEIDDNKIIAEWLFHTTSKEVYLFKRDLQDIKINKSSFEEALGKETDVKENVLFLSLLATLGKETSSSIVEWFKKFNFVNGIHDRGHKRYTIDKLKSDKNFFNWVLHFIKYLEISSLSTTEEDVNDIDLEVLKEKEKDEEIINLLTSIHKIQSKQPKRDQLITYHRKYDENNILIDSVPFNFDKQESEGTKKLLYLLGPWFDTLQNGKVLLVDELDSRLHSHLTLRLIDFFHKFNTNHAQLICAVHDISLLNKENFRRDQIWFVEKNQFGASELVSLGDFKTDKVRNKSAFDKNYLDGKYGAIPYFDIDEKLNQLLYGKGK